MLLERKVCTKCGIEKPLSEFYKKRSNCKECTKAYRKKPAVREKAKIQHKAWASANKDKIKTRHKAYYEANKSKIIAHNDNYRKNNKEAKERRNAHCRERYKIDSTFKLNCTIRSGIYKTLKGIKSGNHWENLVDYTLDQLKSHLEKLFSDGMNWDNYGKNGWVIDHKIPISVFNFTGPDHEDFKQCWALKNLQPLWEYENLAKKDKITKHFQPSLLI